MRSRLFRQPNTSIGLVVIDLLVFSQSNPNSDIVVVLLAIGLVVLTIWSATSYIVRLYLSYAQANAGFRSHQRLTTMIIAGSLSYIVLMQSIGQLNFADVLALIPFGGLLFLYQTYGQQDRSRPFEPTKRS